MANLGTYFGGWFCGDAGRGGGGVVAFTESGEGSTCFTRLMLQDSKAVDKLDLNRFIRDHKNLLVHLQWLMMVL